MISNYAKAFNTSVRVLKKYNINSVPIDIHNIIKQIPNMKLCTYSKFAKSYKCSIGEVVEFFQSDLGAIVREPKTDRYIIYYNDMKNNQGLARFTIAHELGHYFLGHFNLLTKKVLNRGGFTLKQYKALENEANCFARNLLCPILLYKKVPKNSLTFIWDVMEVFNISYEAAVIRDKLSSLDIRQIRLEHVRYFNTYKMPYYICCCHCKHPNIKRLKYCPICGQKVTEKALSIIWKFKGGKHMIYNGITVDENSKAKVCPICNNEEPEEGEYCSICGTYLVNRCTNIEHPGRYEEDPPCGELLAGNARYCTYCGAPSTFLKNNLLKPWNEIVEEMEEQNSISELPF